MVLSKFINSFLSVALLCSLAACSQDEPEGSSPKDEQESKLSVTINADGSTNNGAVFSQIDGTTFFLDFVKYKVVDSHLEIIGYDSVELPKSPKLYANVSIDNTVYKTRTLANKTFENVKISSIILPETITTIGAYAFSGCTSLTQISFPDALTYIGEEAFSHCTSLTQISLPNALTEIGQYAFSGCTSLTQISVPDAIKYIGYGAFSNCTSLTQISLPDALTEINYKAFWGCISLRQITFSDAMTKIGSGAFSGCTSLTQITFPDALTEIGNSAFLDCTSLRQITFPDALTEIGYRAFYNCSSLQEVTFLGLTHPNINYDAFTSRPTAYVKPEALDNYKDWWAAPFFSAILPISE